MWQSLLLDKPYHGSVGSVGQTMVSRQVMHASEVLQAVQDAHIAFKDYSMADLAVNK